MNTPRRLYIEDYARRRPGRWYALDDYADVEELETAIKAANHPESEEYQICDFEGFPAGLLGTYTGHCEAWAWHEAFEETGDAAGFYAFLMAFGTGYFNNAEQALEIYNRIGYDVADTEADFAEEYAESRGLIPRDMDADDIRQYIDWQGYWDRKLCYEYTAQRVGEQLFFFPANW